MTEKFLIGTYTRSTSKGIYQVELDTENEKLMNAQLVAEVGSPTYVVESEAHRVYACDRHPKDEEMYGGIYVTDGEKIPMPEIQERIEKGTSPAYVAVYEKNNLLFSANYHTGDVSVYKIQNDGTIELTDRVHDNGIKGPRPEQEDGAHPHFADLTPDKRLVVCDLGLDRIYLYDLSDDGKLNPVSEIKMAPGFGPRHITFVEGTGKAYCVGELSSKIAVLDYDEEAGLFSVSQIVSTIPDDWTGHNGAAAIRISSDKKFLYVSNRGNNTIVVFKINEDGSLSQIQRIASEGRFPRDFNFNSDESYVIAANQDSDNMTLYSRNSKNGKLKMIQKNFPVPEGTCVARRK